MTTSTRQTDPFAARGTFDTGSGRAGIYRLSKLEDARLTSIAALPYSIRVLLESCLRNCDGYAVTEDDVLALAAWRAGSSSSPAGARPSLRDGARGPARLVEIPFKPARVVLQDFTGVPCVVDLAAMRSAMARLDGDPQKINPLVPVDLVIDHSVQVDFFNSPGALEQNIDMEFSRNRERYEFLRWGQKAFDNFRVIPPGIGIVHQVNLEYLAKVVSLREDHSGPVALPDSLVGTDSHTTMINGLGVVGWGVGGIEAEGVMLGQPIYMLLPEVVGMELSGELPAGSTATDLVLTVTEILRREKVVGKFVEFCGPGVASMPVADRATIANMAPEYGATMGFFPVDDQTLHYLRQTGRAKDQVELVERYAKEQGLFRTDSAPLPNFTKVVKLDLSTVEPSLAGPKRPQDRVPLGRMKSAWQDALKKTYDKQPLNNVLVSRWEDEGGHELGPESSLQRAGSNAARPPRRAGTDPGFDGVEVQSDGRRFHLKHGHVVIAAITSCTNTSNPAVMVAAGLVARNAVARGLKVPPYVKTSLAPGSRVVTDYLEKAGLDKALEKLGFYTVGYGCTTCIGNSGPLPTTTSQAIREHDLVVAGVLSGNRNFEGRINPDVKANYLASPPLVVAYALAGTTDIDLVREPLGTAPDGRPVYLKDIWPTQDDVQKVVDRCVEPEMFAAQYSDVWNKNAKWNALPTKGGDLYEWDAASTYIQEPPFLVDLPPEPPPIAPIRGARCLAALGDSVTTDHISPAGSIAADSPAGRFLIAQGVEPRDFNSYGSRRGNDRVMTRGTLANIRIRNQLAPGTEGGITRHLPGGAHMTIYDAAMKYRDAGVPLVVLAGTEYGTGSSRDWAAKGTFLLGVRAVLAGSFERIHRSNLVGMGVLPLHFAEDTTWQSLGLTGEEVFDIPDLNDDLQPGQTLTVTATPVVPASRVVPDPGQGRAATNAQSARSSPAAAGNPQSEISFPVTVRIDTPVDLDYYRNGGILQTVLRKLLKS